MNKKSLIPFAVCMIMGLAACSPKASTSSTSSAAQGSSNSSESNPSSSSSSSVQEAKLASGILSYQGATTDQRTELLATEESWLLRNHVAGIPMFDSGGLEEFSSRITLPTRKYIANYGFGTGNASLDATGTMYNGTINESVEAWKSYFHSANTSDAGTFNGWDSSGSAESDRNASIAASYFDTHMNGTKDGYVWRQLLSKTDRPIMLNKAGGTAVDYTAGTTSKYWRVKVKTGDDGGIVYNVASTSGHAAFNGRKVVLEDYLTPFKAMCDYNLKRAADLGAGSYGIAGVAAYTSAQASKFGSGDWSKVGIQLNATEGSIDFEFLTPRTQFQAMYGLNNSMYSPTPEDFFLAIGSGANDAEKRKSGVSAWGKIVSGSDNYHTLDNIISVGAYVPEYWEKDKRLVMKKNPNYVYASEINFDGSVEDIISGTEYGTVTYNMFLDNRLDVVGIPSSQVATHKNDANTLKTAGDSVWCMNFNSCDETEWEYYFGENGVVAKHEKKNYWALKPLLSDPDFLDGVYFSIDRQTMEKKTGRTAGMSPLSDAYAVDGESGLSYRNTEAGKSAIRDYTSVNAYGYDLATAKTLFQKAVARLEAKGVLTPGTEAEPTEIDFTMDWMYTSIITQMGGDYKAYVEDAFNSACPKYKLVMQNVAYGDVDYNITYNKVKTGDYDAMMGSISGSTLDACSFLSVYSSDSTLNQGFHLNYGVRTDIVNEADPLVYDGKSWSFDALYTASVGTAIVQNGLNVPVVSGFIAAPVVDTTAKTTTFTYTVPDLKDDAGKALITYKLNGGIGGNGAGIQVLNAAKSAGGEYYQLTDDDVTVVQDGTSLKMVVKQDSIQKIIHTSATATSGSTKGYPNLYVSLDYKYYLNGSETPSGTGYHGWVLGITDVGCTVE